MCPPAFSKSQLVGFFAYVSDVQNKLRRKKREKGLAPGNKVGWG